MGSQANRHDDEIGPELLGQLKDQSAVLGVYDEGQDIALDLHTGLFDPATRDRALAFLQSPRYASAAQTYQRITTGPIELPSGGE
ncbi:hypothetical protein [Microbacterium testaceum]|uniref:hypothetical protein n=1 Tax=Microbacterium testaceum TaxID=2033 RepID=UPI002AC5B3B1|nr:hypothetical protein [Microbacterium testaceum]MDZ5146355.1 hypothetical protein [Microbacterium testaceum]